MKNIIACIFISFFSLNSYGQDEPVEMKTAKAEKEEGWFKKDHLFTGGDLTLGFSNTTTTLGASPYFGYSINKYLDVAVSFNFNYTSQRDYFFRGDKARQTLYGPGAFVRIYPFKFIFAQAQFEHNFIRLKYIPANLSGYQQEIQHIDANSFLVGAGYAGGRSDDNNSFYYFSVSWDLIRDKNSPYVDGLGRSVPIIRAGYNIALFQGRR
jgi:hypothetical protein